MKKSFEDDPNLVLRAVYLTRDLDLKIRQAAFSQKKTKNEVIIGILTEGIERQITDPKKPWSRPKRKR